MKNENLKKLLKDSENSYIISTKRGVGIIGDGVNVLTQFGMLTEALKYRFPEELLREIFELSFENKSKISKKEEKIQKKIDELFEELLEDINE